MTLYPRYKRYYPKIVHKNLLHHREHREHGDKQKKEYMEHYFLNRISSLNSIELLCFKNSPPPQPAATGKARREGDKKNIKKLRNKHKLSQEKLAQKAGITYTTLAKIESGVNDNPTMKTLVKLANALNVSIDKLIGK